MIPGAGSRGAAARAFSALEHSSSARALSVLRGFFRFLDRRGLAKNAALAAVHTPKLAKALPKALTVAEADAALELAPALAREDWQAADPLTDRERQTLRLAGEGRSGPEIATALGLSEGTVRNYLSDAMTKLRASTRVEAARIARDSGWL